MGAMWVCGPAFWWREPVRGPVRGGDCCANGKGAISARPGAGPHWSVEGSPWLLAVFSKNRRTRYCRPAPSSRPCPPSLFPSQSRRARRKGHGRRHSAGCSTHKSNKTAAKALLHHTTPGNHAARHGCLPLGPSLACPSFTLAKGGTREKEPSPKRRIYTTYLLCRYGVGCLWGWIRAREYLGTWVVKNTRSYQISTALQNRYLCILYLATDGAHPIHAIPR